MEYFPGDVNGDGEVTITDIVGMVSHILRQPTSDLIIEAADLNGDSRISVADIVSVVNMILSSDR